MGGGRAGSVGVEEVGGGVIIRVSGIVNVGAWSWWRDGEGGMRRLPGWWTRRGGDLLPAGTAWVMGGDAPAGIRAGCR